VIALVIAAVLLLTLIRMLVARRRGYAGDATHRIVRCSKGHVFTTVWLPGASLTAIRLGSVRYERCPVGKHWSLVRPVRENELTDDERRSAAQYRHRIP
jgi:hypothetical protein